MGIQHALHGLTAGLLVGAATAPSPAVALGCGAVGLVAAGVPDTDHPFGAIPRALGPVGRVLCAGVRAVSAAACDGEKHRGITHSLFAAVVTGLVLAEVAWLVGGDLATAAVLGLAGLAGVLAALAGDAVTHAGLDWLFWPARRRVRLPKWAAIRVGWWFERLVIAPLSALVAIGAGVWLVATWA